MKKIIIINILPYIIFLIVGTGSAILEAKTGEASIFLEQFLWSLYVFPFLIIGMNYKMLKQYKPIKKAAIGTILGLLFFLLGITIMLLFTKIRLSLGLRI